MFLSSKDEAERWDKAMKEAGGMTCNFQGTNKAVKSVPDLITKDPSAVKNCDVVSSDRIA